MTKRVIQKLDGIKVTQRVNENLGNPKLNQKVIKKLVKT